MKKKYKCYVCQKEIDEEEAWSFKGHIVHRGECIKKLCDEDNAVRKLQQENKQLKNKNKHIEQWWKETNVIIRNEKSLAVNDNAMEYILSLEHKIGKAIDWCNEIIRTFCEDDKQVVVAYEIKEILGDKENE